MEESKSPERKTKVLIIGAGAAGLSAANRLLKNGISDILVVEGRNRIGGRIVAIDIAGRKMELGANWIHGVLGNPIYELASANGLVDIVQRPKSHKVFAALPDGQRASFSILQEIYDAYSCFFRRCEEYYLCKYLPPDGVESVGQHIKLEISIYLQQFSEGDREIRRRIFRYLLNRETCISGCDSMDEIDLMEIGSYTELPGGNIELPGGYSSVLGPLTKNIPSDLILKGHSVSKIKWRPSDYVPLSSQNETQDCSTNGGIPLRNPTNFSVEVSCENGASFLADHVICTVPLGVLKNKGKNLFEPTLPDYKLDVINRLGFGIVDKIFLEYERPFMSSGLTEIIFLWEDTSTEEPVSERWFKKIYSFCKVSETLLMGWLSGDEAKYMETLPFDQVSEKCTEILRQFLNDPCVPKPRRCICTGWWSQPFTRGSYTALSVGSSQDDIIKLSHPLYTHPMDSKPSVMFAGEHCHPSFYSTVHGAYLSGRDAAQKLCLPDTPTELVLDVEGTADLSSWIKGISLE